MHFKTERIKKQHLQISWRIYKLTPVFFSAIFFQILRVRVDSLDLQNLIKLKKGPCNIRL